MAGDIEAIVKGYREAFNAANDYELLMIRYERGWFHIRQKYGSGLSKYRRAKVEEMTETLRQRAALLSKE